MVNSPLPAGYRGLSVDDSSFDKWITHLKGAYQRWELPYILLEKKLHRLEEPVPVAELAEVARDSFFKAHEGKGLNRDDERFSVESFHNIALHAVAALQHKTVEFFSTTEENEEGYMLLVSDTDVSWEPWLEEMKEYVEQANAVHVD